MMSDNDTFQSDHNRLWDISDAETGVEDTSIVVPDLYDYYTGGEMGLLETSVIWSATDVAAGTRISARMQASTTDAADRIGQILMFGLR